MRRITVWILTATAIAGAMSGSTEIGCDSIASFSIVGPPEVSILTVIRNVGQLDSFCNHAGYDTASISVLPDFSTHMVIGLLTVTAGGNRVTYRNPVGIAATVDTLILAIQPDSQVFDVGMSIQAGAHAVLLSIGDTGKTVILRNTPVTAVRRHPREFPVPSPGGRRSPDGCYNLQGRSMVRGNGNRAASPVIRIVGDGQVNILLSIQPVPASQ